MNSSETNNYIVIDRSHYNKDLLYNSKLSTECKTLFFFNETAAKEDTEKVYALHCHYINLHFNKENQT